MFFEKLIYIEPCPVFCVPSKRHKTQNQDPDPDPDPDPEPQPDEQYDMPQVGDTKISLAATGGQGWYELNGQTIVYDALPVAYANAQATFGGDAPAPGATLSLPNMIGRYPLGASSPNVPSGSNAYTLTQANLPVVNLLGTTTSTSWTNGSSFLEILNTGGYGGSGGTGGQNIATYMAHQHAVSVTLNPGAQTQIPITPSSLSVKYFVWLGLEAP